ncbi:MULTISPECIES: FliM/FliN family flagellar motor C-terminal domain-containing protein [unclassified Cupriavidus]|uniref:FliM/FliN family flagellar motor C-terminal domain-containing protein n=1 Tax=Cupriavidus sp. H19C3 TaxID=3241603 RepID=UPI003BF8ECAD
MMTEQRQRRAATGPAARALTWWSDAELGALRASLEARLGDFSRDWGVDVRLSALSNASEAEMPASMRRPEAWWHAAEVVAACKGVWLSSAETPPTTVAQALFGGTHTAASRAHHDAEPSLAATVAAEALLRFCIALTGVPEHGDALASATGFSAAQQLPWSGAIRCVITLEGVTRAIVGCHIEPERARGWIPPRQPGAPRPAAPLTPVIHAMRRQSLRLTARLADIELDLGALLALQPGDVVTTGHGLDQPVTLYLNTELSPESGVDRAAGPAPLLSGHLGAVQATKAIQLLPHVSSNTTTRQS